MLLTGSASFLRVWSVLSVSATFARVLRRRKDQMGFIVRRVLPYTAAVSRFRWNDLWV